MGDFLGSYYFEPEAQIRQESKANGEEHKSSAPGFETTEANEVCRRRPSGVDNTPDLLIHEELSPHENNSDDDFAPITVQPMSIFDPVESMVSVHLTRKGAPEFNGDMRPKAPIGMTPRTRYTMAMQKAEVKSTSFKENNPDSHTNRLSPDSETSSAVEEASVEPSNSQTPGYPARKIKKAFFKLLGRHDKRAVPGESKSTERILETGTDLFVPYDVTNGPRPPLA